MERSIYCWQSAIVCDTSHVLNYGVLSLSVRPSDGHKDCTISKHLGKRFCIRDRLKRASRKYKLSMLSAHPACSLQDSPFPTNSTHVYAPGSCHDISVIAHVCPCNPAMLSFTSNLVTALHATHDQNKIIICMHREREYH